MTRELPIDPQVLLGHAGWMRALAASLVADPGTADDVVQDAWLALLRRAPRADRPLEPWLARVVRNFAFKRRRSAGRRADHETRASASESASSPAETIERLELQRILVDAVLALDEPYRTTLFLHYFEGRTSVEIARSQSVPEGTVRWRLQRGLEHLRVRLDGRFGARSTWGALLVPFAARHEAITIGTASVAGASAVQGAMAMSMALKIGIGSMAGIALVGAAWWGYEQVAPVQPRSDAVALPVESSPIPDRPPVASQSKQEETTREAMLVDERIVEPAAAPAEAPVVEAAPLEPGRIAMRFLDPLGAPQEGVDVDCDGGGTSATSGADGRAELTADSWRTDHGRQVSVRARLEGSATVILSAAVRAGQVTHLGDVVMYPGVTLRGRVVDVNGAGIEGAEVGIVPVDLGYGASGPLDAERDHRHGNEEFGRHAFAQSGPNGAFTIEGVAPGPWRLCGHARDMRYSWTEPIEFASGVDRNGLEVVLEPLRRTDRIEGLVVDPTGNPVPDAQITIIYQGESEGGVNSGIGTDAQGRFRVIIFVEGTYRLVASVRDQRYAEAQAAGLRPGDLDVVLALGEKRSVTVRARDEAGVEVGGVKLQITEVEDQWTRAWTGPTAAGEDARFDLPGFPFLLKASADGRREVRMGPLDPDAIGERIDVEFEALPRLRGEVRTSDGPIAGAEVQVVRQDEEGRLIKNDFPMRMETHASAEGRSRDDGSFELGIDLDPSERVFVRVLASGWATAELGPMSVAEATEEALDVELTRGGILEGRVLRADGRDGGGVIVGINCGDGDARTQRAGPGGTFRFELLRPGEWQVLARDAEISPSSTSVRSQDTGKTIEWSCEIVDGRTTRYDLPVER